MRSITVSAAGAVFILCTGLLWADLPTFDQAVISEPLAIAAYSVDRAQLPNNANVAVLGAGPVGLCTFVSAKAAGVKNCYITDKIDERANAAKEAGATWAGNPDKQDIVKEIQSRQLDGLDAAFECAGQQETIDQCVELLRPGGNLVLTGIPRFDKIYLPIDKLRRKELTIINIRRQNKFTQKAVDLISS